MTEMSSSATSPTASYAPAQNLSGCTELVVDQRTIWNMPCIKEDSSDCSSFSVDCWLGSPSGLAMRGSNFPSKIAVEDIEEMRTFLAGMGSSYFCSVFEQCIQHVNLSQLTQNNTYRKFLGIPIEQTVPNTCAIVSSTVCMEVHHRWEYEMLHGSRTFPCIAAAPRKLRSACHRGILRRPDSRPHHRALDTHGPFVGTLWVCPWYHLFDAEKDKDLVYRSGCAQNLPLQEWTEWFFGKDLVGLHSVLCFEYRVRSGQLDVLILDNHAPNGPERWIHFYELEEVHTIRVERMDPPLHLGERTITYPQSSR
ncbi:hypothetical protein C2845_PM09G03640 [Panicum miliaceum]|uniref:Uncharacterized protein n=1 Tax=Panicum miliaceum TaxID=4540 RepID=A0A3L6S0S4_PANMI|nr:hypothetical protein C2845_PM09G03640 [Panicum miliaceum]